MSEKPRGVIVGIGKCPICGKPQNVKAMKNGHLSVKCYGDGGSCSDTMSRSDAADGVYARNVTKWVNPDFRRAYLGADPLPKKAQPKKARAEKPAMAAPVTPNDDWDYLK